MVPGPTLAVTKTYDGTTSADGASVTSTRLTTFADRNADSDKDKQPDIGFIGVSDGNNGRNDDLTYVPSTKSRITPAPLTVTANGDRKAYDATPYEGGNGVVVAGLAGGDNADTITGQLGYGGTAQGALLPGS